MPQALQIQQNKRGLTASLLLAPATVFVAISLLVPMAILFRYSLNAFVPGKFMVDALTLDNYIKFFTDPYYASVLLRTMRVASICTLICLIVGFPLAYVLARTQSRFKNILIIAVVLPLFVGNAVRAAGWMVSLGNKGAFNQLMISLKIIDTPVEIMYTELAVLLGIIAVNLPFMVLTLQSVIESIPRHVEEAAFSLGAPPFRMFRLVLWPLAMPGILAMNAYATPVLLGGPKFQMMGTLIYGQFAQQNNWPFGGAISFVLMSTTLVLTSVAQILHAHKK